MKAIIVVLRYSISACAEDTSGNLHAFDKAAVFGRRSRPTADEGGLQSTTAQTSYAEIAVRQAIELDLIFSQ
jgi:hypothetical protein